MRPAVTFGLAGAALVVVVVAAVLVLGRPDGRVASDVAGGDPERGRVVAAEVGCGACHSIPGVDGADSLLAPPLDGFRERTYVAGVLHNQPEDLVAWLLDPQAVAPGTAMPNVGLDEQGARDVAAYLRTLAR